MSGTVVQTLILATITMRYDWEKEVCFNAWTWNETVLSLSLVSFSFDKIDYIKHCGHLKNESITCSVNSNFEAIYTVFVPLMNDYRNLLTAMCLFTCGL